MTFRERGYSMKAIAVLEASLVFLSPWAVSRQRASAPPKSWSFGSVLALSHSRMQFCYFISRYNTVCLSPVSFPAAPVCSWRVHCLCFSFLLTYTLTGFLLSKCSTWSFFLPWSLLNLLEALPWDFCCKMVENWGLWLPDSLVVPQAEIHLAHCDGFPVLLAELWCIIKCNFLWKDWYIFVELHFKKQFVLIGVIFLFFFTSTTAHTVYILQQPAVQVFSCL